MGDFKIINMKALPEKMQHEVTVGLFSAYMRPDLYGEVFKEFSESLREKETVLCMVNKGKLMGAISYLIEGNSLKTQELWAKPSREYLAKNKKTIGRALYDLTVAEAKQKGLKLKRSGPHGSGIRFRKRNEGKLPSYPHKLLKKRKAAPKRHLN